nr:reverse transcriptase [Tanacetum cinerariifolium]
MHGEQSPKTLKFQQQKKQSKPCEAYKQSYNVRPKSALENPLKTTTVIGERTIKLQPNIIKKIVNFNEEELKTKKGLRSYLESLNGCMKGWGGIVKWKKSKGDPRSSEKIYGYASGKFSTTQSIIDVEINACINTLENLKIYYLDKQEALSCSTVEPRYGSSSKINCRTCDVIFCGSSAVASRAEYASGHMAWGTVELPPLSKELLLLIALFLLCILQKQRLTSFERESARVLCFLSMCTILILTPVPVTASANLIHPGWDDCCLQELKLNRRVPCCPDARKTRM